MKLNKAEIISEANARPQRIRYGQAIFNVAYKMYPNAVNKLRGTDLDCFYQDEKVDKFLNALENLLLIITLAYLPQCIFIYKTKDTCGLSFNTFLAIWIGMLFWIVHSIIINDLPLLISSLASFTQNSYILYNIIKNRSNGLI